MEMMKLNKYVWTLLLFLLLNGKSWAVDQKQRELLPLLKTLRGHPANVSPDENQFWVEQFARNSQLIEEFRFVDSPLCEEYFDVNRLLAEEILDLWNEHIDGQYTGDKFLYFESRMIILGQFIHDLAAIFLNGFEGGVRTFGLEGQKCVLDKRPELEKLIKKRDKSFQKLLRGVFGRRPLKNSFYLSNFLSQKKSDEALFEKYSLAATVAASAVVIPLGIEIIGAQSLARIGGIVGLGTKGHSTVKNFFLVGPIAFSAVMGGIWGESYFRIDRSIVVSKYKSNLDYYMSFIRDVDLESPWVYFPLIEMYESSFNEELKKVVAKNEQVYRQALERCLKENGSLVGYSCHETWIYFLR